MGRVTIQHCLVHSHLRTTSVALCGIQLFVTDPLMMICSLMIALRVIRAHGGTVNRGDSLPPVTFMVGWKSRNR